MKIKHITFQGGSGSAIVKFSDAYSEMFSGVQEIYWQLRVKMFVDLLRYLEDEIDAPTQWVTTSHHALVFHDRDCAVYGDETFENLRTTFSLDLTLSDPPQYSIEVKLPEESNPWNLVTGTTGEVEQAGRMIQKVLSEENSFWLR